MRASVPHIVPIHGCAHQLELAIKDAAKQCSLLSSADDIMEHSFKMYHKSPLCWQGLKEKGDELNLVVLKPTKLKGTRWVAHRERALKVVLVNWPVLVQHTNDVRQGGTAMQGRATKLYKELTKPGTVIFLYLLYDLLVVLGRLSRTLQLNSATIETVRRAVLSAQSGLLELCNDKTIATRIEGVLTKTEQTSWRHTSADPKSMDGLVGDPELSDNDSEDSDDSSDEVSEDEVTEGAEKPLHCGQALKSSSTSFPSPSLLPSLSSSVASGQGDNVRTTGDGTHVSAVVMGQAAFVPQEDKSWTKVVGRGNGRKSSTPRKTWVFRSMSTSLRR